MVTSCLRLACVVKAQLMRNRVWYALTRADEPIRRLETPVQVAVGVTSLEKVESAG